MGTRINVSKTDKYRKDYTSIGDIISALESFALENAEESPQIKDYEYDDIVPDKFSDAVVETLCTTGNWRRHKNGFSLYKRHQDKLLNSQINS